MFIRQFIARLSLSYLLVYPIFVIGIILRSFRSLILLLGSCTKVRAFGLV